MERLMLKRANRGFDWAHNNCLSFASDAAVAQGGKPLPTAWRTGYSTPRLAMRCYVAACRDGGYAGIIDGVDDVWRREMTLHPTEGMIVARADDESVMQYIFGVVYGGVCWFIGLDGLYGVTPGIDDMFWSVA